MPKASQSVATDYLIPEINVRVSRQWIRLIHWTQTVLPNGQLCVKVNGGQPSMLVPEYTKKNVRFDKEEDVPINFEVDN